VWNMALAYQIDQAAKFNHQTVCPNNPTGTARPWRAWLRTDFVSCSWEFETRAEAVAYLAAQAAKHPLDTRARYDNRIDRTQFAGTFLQQIGEGGEVSSLADLELVPVYTVALPPAAPEPAADEVIEISACVDCLLFVANGDVPEHDEALPERIRARLGDGASRLVCAGGDDDGTEFSWSPCECCGSRLGGMRHALAIIAPREI
jgi:hypothetical protein